VGYKLRKVMLMKVEELKESLQQFYSEYGNLTVKELLTGTSNIALPTMVQTRAILELKNWIDLRTIAHRVRVPKGSGKTAKVQIITQPTYSD